jgi:two-component system chemotaxis sensor kinase CheA
MTEELQLFCEDMDEQLTIMEETLLDMMEIPLDEIESEMINKLFRAMHTMKGNAGMFGFDTVVSFAHVAENLLDEIRHEKIALTSDMLDLFLVVNDHSKTLIDVTVNNEELDEDNLEQHNSLLAQLSEFLGTKSKTIEAKTEETKDQEELDIPIYNMSIKPKDTFFANDMDIMAIIKFLNIIGDVEDLAINGDDIPTIDKLEPLKSYINITMKYSCEESLEEIKKAFEFVQNDIELKIEDVNQKEEPKTQPKATPTKEIPKKTKPKKPTTEKKTQNKSFSLRVDSSKVDILINLISEMVIANAKVTQIANTDENTELQEASDTLTAMLEEIRTNVMEIRMVQVGSSFQKLRRIVSDTAKKLGKDIEFVISGEETELDKTVIEKISDPLVHMLRNSVDHGVESVEKRRAVGKKEKGRIDLRPIRMLDLLS